MVSAFGQTVKLIEQEADSSALQVLANLAVIQVSSALKVGALEGDFLMARMAVNANFTEGPMTDTVGELEHGPMFLILARGDMSTSDVAAAMTTAFNVDLTPAGGSLNAVKVSTEKGIIWMAPFKFTTILNDESAAEYTVRFALEYNGPPLGMSLEEGRKRSYLFPKNIGWAWFVFNAGRLTDDQGKLDLFIRSTGKFIDD